MYLEDRFALLTDTDVNYCDSCKAVTGHLCDGSEATYEQELLVLARCKRKIPLSVLTGK